MSTETGPMDPNAVLTELRAIVARARFDDLTSPESHRLVELVEALDSWIARGGFLPAAWLTFSYLATTAERDVRWWWVRPAELALRYGGDADRLLDAINPEHLNDRQFDLVVAAQAICKTWTAMMTTPEE